MWSILLSSSRVTDNSRSPPLASNVSKCARDSHNAKFKMHFYEISSSFFVIIANYSILFTLCIYKIHIALSRQNE